MTGEEYARLVDVQESLHDIRDVLVTIASALGWAMLAAALWMASKSGLLERIGGV